MPAIGGPDVSQLDPHENISYRVDCVLLGHGEGGGGSKPPLIFLSVPGMEQPLWLTFAHFPQFTSQERAAAACGPLVLVGITGWSPVCRMRPHVMSTCRQKCCLTRLCKVPLEVPT